jgi:hypothetical protein
MYIKDFSDVLTFSESHHCINKLIQAITRYITNIANQIYLAISRIFHPALDVSQPGTL